LRDFVNEADSLLELIVNGRFDLLVRPPLDSVGKLDTLEPAS
jgi:hypothetical protein